MVIEGTPQVDNGAGLAKNMTVETPNINYGAMTRAGYTAAFNTLYFQNEDAIRAYDNDFFKYDTYKYDKETAYFKLDNDGTPEVTSAGYVLYPTDYLSYGTWGNEQGTVVYRALVTIPETFEVNQGTTWKEGEERAYTSYLPLGGTTKYENNKLVGGKLKFLTAGLVLVIDNTRGVVDKIKITCGEQDKKVGNWLTGAFDADMLWYTKATDDSKLPKLAKAKNSVAKTWGNEITVDIKNAAALGNRYIVTIPIIPAEYHNLKVKAIRLDGTEDLIKEWGCTGTEGTDGHKHAEGSKFERNDLRLLTYNPSIDVTSPKSLQEIIEGKKELTGTVVVTASENSEFKMDKGTGTEITEELYTVKMPQMEADRVVIEVPAGIQNKLGKDYKLVINDDPAFPFDKEIVLNLGTYDRATTEKGQGVTAGGLEINLPKAKVVLAGFYNPVDANETTYGIHVEAAKEISFGDGETKTCVGGNCGVSWKRGAVTDAITIAEYTDFDNDLDLENNGMGGNANFKLNINGVVNSKVTSNKATVTIGGGE